MTAAGKETTRTLDRRQRAKVPGRGAARIIDMADPARDEAANELQGHYHDAGVSFIVT